MAHILVVEDHENILRFVKECLLQDGHQIATAENLKTAREKINVNPDLIILDWMLSDGQGIDFLSEIRKQGFKTPVIFLTARVELVDKVLGLEMGANDYMTKPFESRELLARVRVQLRDHLSHESKDSVSVQVGTLKIDRLKHQVHFQGRLIELVRKEFDLLVLFAESPEKVFSREEILNKVWGFDHFPTTRTVDTHVMLLRQKIHSDLIETVRAVGYKLNPL